MRALVAFLLRDGRESRSFAGAWLLEAAGILLTVLTFYFLGKWVDDVPGRRWLTNQVPSYFGYAMSGLAVAVLLFHVTRGHSQAIRQAGLSGTLEPLLMTPLPPWQLALGCGLRSGLWALLRALVYLGLSAALGALPAAPPLIWVPPVLLLSYLSFLPFGLLAASVAVVFKRGDPVTHLTNAATLLLAGVYFPPSVLPEWLQPMSAAYPVSHAVAALRCVTLGTDLPHGSLVWLMIFIVTALPASAWVFERSVARARETGTLGQG